MQIVTLASSLSTLCPCCHHRWSLSLCLAWEYCGHKTINYAMLLRSNIVAIRLL